jgi:8-oxo-dGTP diphosphatase
MSVRVSVSALIVHDGALLLVRKDSDEEPRYTFPGGGQEHGETLLEALRREVWEETGGTIEVGDLLWVREYIGAHHQFAGIDANVHIVDHLFRCTLTSEKLLQPVSPDPDQTGIEWVPIEQLQERRLYPLSLLPVVATLAHGAETTTPLYVGDVN